MLLKRQKEEKISQNVVSAESKQILFSENKYVFRVFLKAVLEIHSLTEKGDFHSVGEARAYALTPKCFELFP